MDSEGLLAVDSDDVPLLVATLMIAVGCLPIIIDLGGDHPLAAVLVISGTVAFVMLMFQRVAERNPTVIVAGISMILGSVLVSVPIPHVADFDGPVGAALFLFGAIRLSEYVDE